MLKTLLKDSLLYSIAAWCSRIVGLVMIPYYTRIFSPAEYGIITILTIMTTVLQIIFSSQVDQSVALYYVTSKNKRDQNTIASTGLCHFIFAFIIALIILIPLGKPIVQNILNANPHIYMTSYIAALIFLFFSALSYYNLNILKWQKKSKLMAGFSIADIFISIALIIIFTHVFKPQAWQIFLGQVISSLIVFTLTTFYLKNIYQIKSISYKMWKKLISFGLPLVSVNIMIYLVQYADRIIITHMLGLHALGIFSVAAKLSSVILLLTSGLQAAWGPFILSQYDNPNTPKLIAEIFALIICISSIIIIGASLFSSNVLRIITTNSYYAAYTIVPILIANALLNCLINYFTIGITLAKKNKYRVYINIIGVILNTGLNILLISAIGIIGSAIATLITFIVVFIASAQISNKYYLVKFPKMLTLTITLTTALLSMGNLWLENKSSAIIKVLIFLMCLAALSPTVKKICIKIKALSLQGT